MEHLNLHCFHHSVVVVVVVLFDVDFKFFYTNNYSLEQRELVL